MSDHEVFDGARTIYHGSEKDWKPTKEFVETWYWGLAKDMHRFFVKIADVNYATDPKVDGIRTAHYSFETYFGMTQYQNIGGGVIFTRENPKPWIDNYRCMDVNLTLPYLWFNPELKSNEPGYIQVEIIAPLDTRFPETMQDTAKQLLDYARRLEHGYNHMIDTEYEGSRNTLVANNEDATFSVTVSLRDPHNSQ